MPPPPPPKVSARLKFLLPHELRDAGFDQNAVQASATFNAAGMVYALRSEFAGDAVKVWGKIATRTLQPVEARATVLPRGIKYGQCEIHSTCTCVEGSMCKHVAGILQAARNEWYSPREDLRELDEAAAPPSQESTAVPRSEPAVPKPAAPPVPASTFLESWLLQAEALENGDDEEDNFFPPQETSNRLLYVFRPRDPGSQRIALDLLTARLTKDGAYVRTADFQLGFKTAPDFLSPAELPLVESLRHLRTADGKLEPAGPLWAVVLPRIAASGRAFWREINGPGLQWSREPIAVQPAWQTLENGRQKPVLAAVGRSLAVIPTQPLLVIDTTSATVHPVRGEKSERFLIGWLNLPELSPQDADCLAGRLEAKAARAPALPAPARLHLVEERDTIPRPVLRLFCDTVFANYYGWTSAFAYDQQVRMAAVEFIYPAASELRFEYGKGPPQAQVRAEDRVVRLVRNLPVERDFADALTLTKLRPLGTVLAFGCKPALREALVLAPDLPTQWFQLLTGELKRLEEKGWLIDTAPSFDLDVLHPTQWYEVIEESDRPDWFTIDCGVEIDGQPVQLLPLIIAFLRSEGSAMVLEELAGMGEQPIMLPVGKKFLPFPANRMRRILDTLTELFSVAPDQLKDGKLELHRLRAAQLAARLRQREELMIRRTAESLAGLVDQLGDDAPWRHAAKPSALRADLRPYQMDGCRWLRFLSEARLGGILADDMGLGKTLQTLAHLLAEKESGEMDLPSLIVAPKSVVFNWAEEAARFTPKLRCLIYTGGDRGRLLANFKRHDLILTSYPILARDEEVLSACEFHYAILDEAQNIKNSATRTAAAAFRINARKRLCLTGTPMENHLGELWSIFHFLMPGLLGTRERFAAAFRDPIEKEGNEERREFLRQRIAPVLLRRTKEAVLQELPPKIETIHRIELSAAQKDLYETVRAAMDKRVQEEISKKGADRSQITILDALLKLRQVCCDPRLLKLDAARDVSESAKLDALMEVLPPLIEDGRRILLFSQFTEMLALIEQRLNAEGIRHLLLTGQTENRGALVREFQNGMTPVFLISLKAGGVGLNLTAADTVIHYDPWWNPAAENQATDRAHRFGQQKTVFVYKFICQDTIEEKILQLQRRKAELVQGLLEGSGGPLKIDAADIAALLAPLKQ
ncbi:MAG: DEAD/DEAH box helicase [Verrucomicrobiales bacterium]|nr:DEAD/DEAH box helicase [Verrucomicrobiales bacterium]